MEEQNSVLEAYKELLSWEIVPSQEITKLVNRIIACLDGADNEEMKEWFDDEITHLWFVIERVGELEKALQDMAMRDLQNIIADLESKK